jgi:CheY-like chemotaxis protein
VLIEESDSGAGIPREIIAQLFEPFFTTKEPGQGSGLGLSMVFGFIKQSGGHVAVQSELGRGSTFRLYLPRDANAEPPEDDDNGPESPPGGLETKLVVEDNRPLCRVTAHGLRTLGNQVLEAETANAALDVLAGHDETQLLFANIVLPSGMDGVVLPKLAVLLTSGFPDMRGTGAGERAAELGCRLLSKPYRQDELAYAAREALDGHPIELIPAG